MKKGPPAPLEDRREGQPCHQLCAHEDRTVAIMRFDEEVAEILRDLPGNGPLFPYLRTVRRATGWMA